MTDATATRAAPRSRGFKASLFESVLVLLIGASVGAAYAMTRPATVSPAGSGEAAARSATEPSAVVDLPPIVTTLASPPDVWIRLEASIVVDPRAEPHPEALAALIGDDSLAYVRTLSLRQLEGPIGLEALRADLNDRAVTRSGGKARELVLRTVVVQ